MIQINWMACNNNPFDGYGHHSLNMLRALQQVGGIDLTPLPTEVMDWPGWMRRLAGIPLDRLTISLMPPRLLRALPCRQWCFTMYESTCIPAGWATAINRHCERLIVPSAWLIEIFEEGGVEIPVHVIPEGIWPDEWPVLNGHRDQDKPYTFLALGDRGSRKAHEKAYAALYEAFGDQDDVRLIIKVRQGGLMLPDGRGIERPMLDLAGSDGRVSVWRENVADMADVYAAADCFVFPSRGEGWGLPPRQAAAMGIPVITTNWGGLTVGIEHYAYPVGYKMVESRMPGGGQWAEPNTSELAERMRWCYENRKEARQFGIKAAEWLRKNQTWMQAAQAFKYLLERET